MSTNPGDYWDYIHGGTGKGMPVTQKPLPIVAITTTAGTGSEADPWGVVTNEQTQDKIGFGYNNTFPVLSIVDPQLMTTVPAKFTAYQGFDAFFHSAEGYISNGVHPVSDMFALTAIENISHNLAGAVKDGNDLEAREKVALGNTLSGVVESIGAVTSQHSLEHAMSAFHQKLPHSGGGMAHCETDIQKACQESNFGQGGVFYGGAGKSTNAALEEWINEVVTIKK